MSLTDPGRGDRSSQVVEALRRRGGEATSAQIAEDLHLHASTARFHLDHLVAEGRVRTRREQRTTRGRPRTIFQIVADPDDGPRSYRVLADILVGAVAQADDPAEAGRRAGASWGRNHGGEVVPVLEEMGFAPEQDGEVIALRHCPFIDLAAGRPEIVCPVHQGVVEGLVGQPVVLEAHPGSTCYLRPGEAGQNPGAATDR
ncbi:helix-turn-helix transcriptional regulator [Acidipropionibacterium timonense]|uniref:helix-turn-helix transcriptional regulator n=1 Tax=Acidipropionibacterium timonense TaxID=2161818 RepID=UPI0010319850|nr:helix-turn-helix domain-containing protein [Acidipropionibacterium timonense]